MNNKDDKDWFPNPKGNKKLRDLLFELNGDESPIMDHPLYEAGYLDGYRHAQENHRLLTTALAKVYNVVEPE